MLLLIQKHTKSKKKKKKKKKKKEIKEKKKIENSKNLILSQIQGLLLKVLLFMSSLKFYIDSSFIQIYPAGTETKHRSVGLRFEI